MKLTEKIQNLTDAKVTQLFKDFENHIATNQEIPVGLKNIYGQLAASDSPLKLVTGASGFTLLEVELSEAEAAKISRATLLEWAKSPSLSSYLEEFMEEHLNMSMAAVSTVLAAGGVLSMLLITTSLKLEYKDKQWYFSYTTENISENAIILIGKLLELMPDALIKIERKEIKKDAGK